VKEVELVAVTVVVGRAAATAEWVVARADSAAAGSRVGEREVAAAGAVVAGK
jgi:hypothetical protein